MANKKKTKKPQNTQTLIPVEINALEIGKIYEIKTTSGNRFRATLVDKNFNHGLCETFLQLSTETGNLHLARHLIYSIFRIEPEPAAAA